MTDLVGTMLSLVADTVAKIHDTVQKTAGSTGGSWQEQEDQEECPDESEWIVRHQLSSHEREDDATRQSIECDRRCPWS